MFITRTEVTNKLQSLMQQNCNEALKLLKSDSSGLGASLLGSTLYALSPAKPSQLVSMVTGGGSGPAMATTTATTGEVPQMSSGVTFASPQSSAYQARVTNDTSVSSQHNQINR